MFIYFQSIMYEAEVRVVSNYNIIIVYEGEAKVVSNYNIIIFNNKCSVNSLYVNKNPHMFANICLTQLWTMKC